MHKWFSLLAEFVPLSSRLPACSGASTRFAERNRRTGFRAAEERPSSLYRFAVRTVSAPAILSPLVTARRPTGFLLTDADGHYKQRGTNSRRRIAPLSSSFKQRTHPSLLVRKILPILLELRAIVGMFWEAKTREGLPIFPGEHGINVKEFESIYGRSGCPGQRSELGYVPSRRVLGSQQRRKLRELGFQRWQLGLERRQLGFQRWLLLWRWSAPPSPPSRLLRQLGFERRLGLERRLLLRQYGFERRLMGFQRWKLGFERRLVGFHGWRRSGSRYDGACGTRVAPAPPSLGHAG
jgi:hypothetical protein